MNKKITTLIQRYQLQPHPEGGYYHEVYRADEQITSERFQQTHCASTSIYYLLVAKQHSAFHRLGSDEIFHFYQGTTALKIHIIDTQGKLQTKLLGIDNDDQQPQLMIPQNCWFAAELSKQSDDDYVLSGCTVAPGFEFEDFELAKRAELIGRYPQHEKIIGQLT
ncbi:MAG: cupin domain-containing protein [Gammaproteobacteria bacterium]